MVHRKLLIYLISLLFPTSYFSSFLLYLQDLLVLVLYTENFYLLVRTVHTITSQVRDLLRPSTPSRDLRVQGRSSSSAQSQGTGGGGRVDVAGALELEVTSAAEVSMGVQPPE